MKTTTSRPRAEEARRRLAAVAVAAAWLVSLAAVLGRSLQHHWIEPWSPRYLLLGVLPTLLLGGLAVAVTARHRSVAPWFRRNPVLGNTFGLFVLGVSVVWAGRFPTSRRQLAVFALVLIAALIWMSLSLRRSGLLLSAGSVAILVVVVAVFEVADGRSRPVVWGEASTMERTFPRDPPFIGPGGRLNSNLSNWMVRSGVEDLGRVWIRTNSLGFRNDEEVVVPSGGEHTTVLSLGDSFSNGFGIGQDDFYGSLLQARLRETFGPQSRVWSAEVSDPCYGLRFLQDFGYGYRPDVILLNLSGNDVLQSLWACGPDTGALQLAADGRLVARPDRDRRSGHRHERWQQHQYPREGDAEIEDWAGLASRRRVALGALSRLRLVDRVRLLNPPRFRGPDTVGPGELTTSSASEQHQLDRKLLFDGFPSLGMAYRRDLPPKEESLTLFFRLLDAMHAGARESGAVLMVVYFPQRHQVQDQDWDVLRRRWGLDPQDFELGQEPRRIGEFCDRRGIAFVDLSGVFRREGTRANLYLPYDGHPNELGHAVAAEEVAGRVVGSLETIPAR